MDLLAYMLASGGDDDHLKIWFWVVVGAIYLIKMVVNFLKPKEEEKEKPILDTEDNHEKRVKEVIAEMRRTPPQPPQHAPRPSAPPVELPNPSVARKPRPAPASVPERAVPTAQQAARNVLEQYVKATEEAQQSMRALSDAEQAALRRLQEREMKENLPEPLPAVAPDSPLTLKNSLRRSQSLKTAILYQEILGKPRALRGVSFSGE
ncbi:hypothetical protein [Akkermansia muciniphila]|uniref:hypothetical protein n=1 Tax=Akkermansia muciniphila TaxID=239935 RepID=UPI001BFF1989|nr:hypothetical protein [Akkermansia muciniphila]MBT8777159.1 hypothetical protein [Akkermansia muciniphila]